jgi:FG-GAP-like repeat
MGAVTQQRPTLRWVLGDGTGTPVVDLCRDRACTQPLAAPVQIAADHRSAVPMVALPAGWVYWRVRVVAGDQVVASRTWQFWVGRSSASGPVDSSAGVALDINGDGYPDFVVGAADARVVHVYLGSAGVSATDWNGASAPARIDLLTFDPANSRFGVSVTSAGDVNGDGYGDFLVACPGGGKAYLYLGSATPRDDDWNGLASPRRIDVTAQGGPGFGGQVQGVGDVNGDGFADFLVTTGRATHLYLGLANPVIVSWNGDMPTSRIDIPNPGSQIAGLGNAGALFDPKRAPAVRRRLK